MRKTIWISVFLLMLSAAAANLKAEESITGLWVMPDASAILQIRPVNSNTESDSFEIRIVSVLFNEFSSADDVKLIGLPRSDLKNPNESLRHRSLEGLTIGHGFELDDGKLTGGSIYDPESGKHYRAQLKLEEDGLLRVRAYLGFAAIGQTMHWRRANQFKSAMLQMLEKIPD